MIAVRRCMPRSAARNLWRVCGAGARTADRRPQAAGLLAGEREGEAGAAAHLLGDRQTEAAALGVASAGLVGAEGPLADLRQVGRRHPRAVVDDGEREPGVTCLF